MKRVNRLAAAAMLLSAVVALVPLLVFVATPAQAQEDEGFDEQIVLTGRVDIGAGEKVGDVVIFNGPATVAGDVHGSLVVFNGDASVSGTVQDDVVVFNGSLKVSSGARVGGDLVSGSAPIVDAEAIVEGNLRRIRPREFGFAFTFFTRLAVWLAVSISSLVLGLLVLLLIGPRAAEALFAAATTRMGASIGWGFLIFFGLPIGAILALVTLVGIPLGLVVLLGLALLYSVGYVASAFVVGRGVARSAGRVLAFVIGLAILRAVALIPLVGGITWFLGAVFGLGVLVVAAWRVRTSASSPAVERTA